MASASDVETLQNHLKHCLEHDQSGGRVLEMLWYTLFDQPSNILPPLPPEPARPPHPDESWVSRLVRQFAEDRLLQQATASPKPSAQEGDSMALDARDTATMRPPSTQQALNHAITKRSYEENEATKKCNNQSRQLVPPSTHPTLTKPRSSHSQDGPPSGRATRSTPRARHLGRKDIRDSNSRDNTGLQLILEAMEVEKKVFKDTTFE